MIVLKSNEEIERFKELTEDEKKRAKAKLRGITASNTRKANAGKSGEVKPVEIKANSIDELKEMLKGKPEIDINDTMGFNSALVASAKTCMREGLTKEEILDALEKLCKKKMAENNEHIKMY